jgi:hypothetical protein
MKSALRIIVLSLGLACGAAAAQAAVTANFQANCQWSGNNVICVYDASRPTGSGSSCSSGISSYFWDLGDPNDPNAIGYTTSSYVSHTYLNATYPGYTVRLTVFCNDGTSTTTSRPICIGVGYYGCININGTWN